MTRTVVFILALAAATLTAPLAEAQRVSFDRLALHLDQGDRVTVTDGAGHERQGRILDLSSSTLSLQVDGLRHDLDRADVSVIRRRERDSLKNGATIGFAVGMAAPVMTALALFGTADYDDAGWLLFLSSLTGAGGMGIGIGLDALHEESRVVYRAASSNPRLAVSPVVSPERQGVSVSLGF